MKTLIFLIFIQNFLCASQFTPHQIILVVSKDNKTPYATLQSFEKNNNSKVAYKKRGKSFSVSIGRNGLGKAESIFTLKSLDNKIVKKEGDGKAPSGIFTLGAAFSYSKQNYNLNFFQAKPTTLCIDDSDSKLYNTIVTLPLQNNSIKSFEWMKRQDNLYKYGMIINHNPNNIPKNGSCVFFHIQHKNETPTSGCTAMQEKNLKNLLSWLHHDKNPILIQIPQQSCSEIEKLFSGVKCPNLMPQF